jgi:membrane dipeptidase
MMLRFLDTLINVIEAHPTECAIARTVAEAQRINAQDRMSIFLHCTGAWINGDMAVLRTYYRLGVRAIHVCVEGLRGVGDQSDDGPVFGGLSDLGRKIVREMNRLGMVVDVSHASDASARQMIELSDTPVISSHTCCRALCKMNRNLPDELIEAIARKGGVIGMHFASGLIIPPPPTDTDQAERLNKAYRDRQRRLRATHADPYEFLAASLTMEAEQEIADAAGVDAQQSDAYVASMDQLIDHIDHVVKIAGIDHVGLGTDYDIGGPPKGLETAAKLSNLTEALLNRNYSEGDVRKILGGNFERVFRQVLDA